MSTSWPESGPEISRRNLVMHALTGPVAGLEDRSVLGVIEREGDRPIGKVLRAPAMRLLVSVRVSSGSTAAHLDLDLAPFFEPDGRLLDHPAGVVPKEPRTWRRCRSPRKPRLDSRRARFLPRSGSIQSAEACGSRKGPGTVGSAAARSPPPRTPPRACPRPRRLLLRAGASRLIAPRGPPDSLTTGTRSCSIRDDSTSNYEAGTFPA